MSHQPKLRLNPFKDAKCREAALMLEDKLVHDPTSEKYYGKLVPGKTIEETAEITGLPEEIVFSIYMYTLTCES